MRHRLLATAVAAVALGAGAAEAYADEPPAAGTQTAEQVADSRQHADSNATSTQYGPENQNISVRVLSPGDGGDVTQTNASEADSFAGNDNSTDQSLSQTQSGTGSVAEQAAGQLAENEQSAKSDAESTQVKPKNQNISVRVLSPGDDGAVDQSNTSKAKSGAKNSNELTQDLAQTQSSDCDCKDGVGIQAAAQEAFNKQKAESSARSKQFEPKNTNISVRVLSPGDGGSVSQSNDSSAFSFAHNDNSTAQSLMQDQRGSGCKCDDGVGIQAAAQVAENWQSAKSSAESVQVKPTNRALSLRFKSPGKSGHVTQANSSLAASFARNRNALEQMLEQRQGS